MFMSLQMPRETVRPDTTRGGSRRIVLRRVVFLVVVTMYAPVVMAAIQSYMCSQTVKVKYVTI